MNDSALQKQRVIPSLHPKNNFENQRNAFENSGSRLEQERYSYKPVRRSGSRLSSSRGQEEFYEERKVARDTPTRMISPSSLL